MIKYVAQSYNLILIIFDLDRVSTRLLEGPAWSLFHMFLYRSTSTFDSAQGFTRINIKEDPILPMPPIGLR